MLTVRATVTEEGLKASDNPFLVQDDSTDLYIYRP